MSYKNGRSLDLLALVEQHFISTMIGAQTKTKEMSYDEQALTIPSRKQCSTKRFAIQ